MAGNKENLLDKLRAQEAGERRCGNLSFADNLLAKIAKMQNKALPEVQEVDERRRVERAWEKMDPACSVVILEIRPGLSRALRRTTTMEEALPLLRAEKARLLGRADDEWFLPPQQTTENCAPLNTAPTNKQLFI